MTGIDWNQLVPVLLSSGVFFQGVAALKWVARVEVRLAALERRR